MIYSQSKFILFGEGRDIVYIFKNAWLTISRNKSRYLLIGTVLMVITISACITLVIHQSSEQFIRTYQDCYPLEVSLQFDRMAFRKDENDFASISLSEEDILNYADSAYVLGYYYSDEIRVASDEVEPIQFSDLFMKPDSNMEGDGSFGHKQEQMRNQGDFRLIAYSDFSYIDAFIDGDYKLVEGMMIDGNSSEMEVVISKDLKDENDLHIGDTISLYLPQDPSTLYTFTVVGIFEDLSLDSSQNPMNMDWMNSQNQLYTNMTSLNQVSQNSSMFSNFSSVFYLHNKDDVDDFYEELRSKGLNDYYTIHHNLESIMETVKPIQNLSSFSITFLFVVFIIGIVVVSFIHLLSVRDRKYEIGILRAIGMSKGCIAIQFILEMVMVSLIAFVFGTGIGSMLSQTVSNYVLSSEVSRYESKRFSILENFGNGDFQSMNQVPSNPIWGREDLSYISTLDVHVQSNTIFMLWMGILFLVVMSSLVAVFFINRYQPNKILQNRT